MINYGLFVQKFPFEHDIGKSARQESIAACLRCVVVNMLANITISKAQKHQRPVLNCHFNMFLWDTHTCIQMNKCNMYIFNMNK